MVANYVKLAFRHLARNRGMAGLTLAGLSIGVAAFSLIALWVHDEMSYDRFHSNSNRIYRAIWDARVGDNAWQVLLVPVPLGEALRQFPEVERSVRLCSTTRWIRRAGDLLEEKQFLYAEPSFFKIFSVHFISGDGSTALSTPDRVVLTRSAALRYFGTGDVEGRSLEMSDGSVFHVSAVVEDFPQQSHFHFGAIVPIENFSPFAYRLTQWGSATCYTYLLLKENASVDALDRKMREYVKQNIVDKEPLYSTGENRTGFIFQSLQDVHLRSGYDYEMEPQGNVKTVYLLGAVGILILLLACVNFVNLATARSAERAREVGVRKAIGSGRRQLVVQFFTESGVLVVLGMGIGSLFAEIALPLLNNLSGKHLALQYADPLVAMAFLMQAAMIMVLAGLYPAVVLSSFAPVRALQGHGGGRAGKGWLRNALVVFQFSICIALMISLFVVRDQLRYMLGKELGFDREHVLVIHGASALATHRDAFVHELRSITGVAAVSLAQTLPGYGFDSNLFEPEQPSNYRQTSLTYALVDDSFLDVLHIKVVEGRNFSPGMPTDSSAVLINRAAAATLGWSHPLGKTLRSGGDELHVIGVVDDFHFESLRSEIKPIVFPFLQWTPQFIAVRLRPGDVRDQVGLLTAAWKKFVPGRPFDYSFLEQDYEKLYRSEERLSKIFVVFTTLALAIACVGLFGLAAYAARQRTKEIGIRKVLGASVAGIVGLLSKQFLLLVLLAGTIGSPLAYVGVQRWLDGFAYRVAVGPLVFLGVVLFAVLVAFATVCYQAIKAALANPVEALRYE